MPSQSLSQTLRTQTGPNESRMKTANDHNLRSFHGVRWKGCDVTRIFLLDLDLHGSLAKEFRELRALAYLDLRDNNITGNLDVFKENTALIRLYLQNTRISRDLQSLAQVTKLERLDLQGTQVSGDVVALSNARGLSDLDLSETKVYGDLVALKNAKDLWGLHLSKTKVYGDMASLANLTHLWTLKLSNTKVSGDFSVISQWKWITRLDLSRTKVSGHPTEDFKDCCKELETLELAWTNVRIMDGFLEDFAPTESWICPFPALRTLDVTRTSLNTTVEKLLSPFVGCKELRTFKAVECSLTGPMPVRVILQWLARNQPILSGIYDWPLSKVLQLLDLSSNNVTKVEAMPRNCRAVGFRDNPQISFGEDVVKKATEHFVSLDLRNATFAHPSEVTDLFDSSVIKKNRARTVIDEQHGFECYDLDSTSIQITPETFAPDRLCSCSPGWKGSGAKCEKCKRCPQGSKAPAGSTSHSSCICDVGVLDNRTGQWRCGCREHEAFLDETCVKCSDFHLSCPSHGTQVFSAQPLKGYTRLKNETHAFECLKPDIRCDAEHVDSDSDVVTHNGSTLGACREGYTDVMCMDCAPKYFSSGNQCERCHDSTTFSTGAPIMVAAIALTLLYIGGASSTSSLLSCQEVDGAGDGLPRQFAFRTAMPYILCHEDSQLKHSVDTLAFSSAFFYGIIIPCCLLYLYGRQHVLFQSNRTTVAFVADHGSLKVSVSKVLDSLDSTVQKTGNVEFTRRLVAAAAASISVLCRGKVSLRVVDGSALIEPLDGSVNAASDHLEPDLLSFIDAEDAKQQAKQQKCWSLCKMLTERSILQDVATSDRVISGAKTLLLKYALCRSIWMEIVQKLVAVFLVSVVASANGLQLSVAITLMMAATSAMVQPFARPQVNRLHCCSFFCLAMAAASFANTWVWTSRAALAIPFLLTAAQAFRPDSLENLAIRLWEELEPQIEALQRGEPVEVASETYNFF
eukprot:symbB.v1.2.014241.t1/scaffold1038.1/size142643/1